MASQPKNFTFVHAYKFFIYTLIHFVLSHVSIVTCDIDIATLSVCLSVTFQYSMETTQHIVIVSSPHGSPIILVL